MIADNRTETLIDEASSFIYNCYDELNKDHSEIEHRINEVVDSIYRSGTYAHTMEELEYGAKLAWRNNSRCIGRLFWKSLKAFDARALQTEDAVAEALFQHMEYAANEGRIRPAITIFAAESKELNIRIWNHQLIRYAGYETDQGIIGDPTSVAFTKQCMKLGWQGEGTAFDILPLVISINNRVPKWYEIPRHLVLEVPLVHPHYEWFTELGLRWYAVPIISDMLLEIGGLSYIAAPFNGWYMATEIAARNLADVNRYNQLPIVAEKMGLDITTNTSFWKDRALIELNEAVYYSFRANKVTIVDHHTASEQFMLFQKQEQEQGREVNGRWSWLIPPLSPATSPIWHSGSKEFHTTPNYSYQKCPFHPSQSASEIMTID